MTGVQTCALPILNAETSSVIQIVNMLGEQVAEVSLVKVVNTIDLTYLVDGVYFIKLNEEAIKFVVKH